MVNLDLLHIATIIIKNALERPIQFLCKRKISIHSSTPQHGYPTIRLPREFKALVGERARIYLSEDKDRLAFKVIIDKKVDIFCANSEKEELEDRLSDLESEITDLRSSIPTNGSLTDNCSEKGAQIDGLGRIRTGDLRHVKATS